MTGRALPKFNGNSLKQEHRTKAKLKSEQCMQRRSTEAKSKQLDDFSKHGQQHYQAQDSGTMIDYSHNKDSIYQKHEQVIVIDRGCRESEGTSPTKVFGVSNPACHSNGEGKAWVRPLLCGHRYGQQRLAFHLRHSKKLNTECLWEHRACRLYMENKFLGAAQNHHCEGQTATNGVLKEKQSTSVRQRLSELTPGSLRLDKSVQHAQVAGNTSKKSKKIYTFLHRDCIRQLE